MYNPHLDRQNQQKRRMTAKDFIEREDKFPHPDRKTMYHISSSLHNPVFEVVYLDKAEADLWKAKHISLLKKDEWFESPIEAVEGRANQLKKAKAEKEKLTNKLNENKGDTGTSGK